MVSEPLVDRLQRLSARVAAGDVVFFVGAGFSLDSEHNDASVLIARLLARFHAIAYQAAHAEPAAADLRTLSDALAEALKSMFSLNAIDPSKDADWKEPEPLLKDVKHLAQNYYLINDWMCSAFDALLDHRETLERLEPVIHEQECRLFDAFVKARKQDYRPADPDPPGFRRFMDLRATPGAAPAARASAGKALFLETMGFGNAAVMAGEPDEARLDAVFASYAGRLRPRHAALAWLALEGLLPAVVTTNYDLLLEGAYRLAGMRPLFPDTCAGSVAVGDGALSWNRRLRNFTPIADATQFFSHGDGHQSALLLKIHGCVHMYRKERCDTERWRRILPTLVFTFREIQNWRDDSWSRDFLRSLLRTRTVAFAGYSTADAVIHDTFRSVYEEMARYRTARLESGEMAGVRTGKAANAFVFRLENTREFHPLEILRAASAAAGDPSPDPTDHPNLLGFSVEAGGFPTLDDVSYWLFHEVYRRLQQQVLSSELRRVAYQLFGKPAPEREAAAIERNFARLLYFEHACAGSEGEPATGDEDDGARGQALAERYASDRRRAHQLSVGWTVDFHRSLMREYAAADLLVRMPEKAGQLHAVLRWPFYSPINEHPDWAAWAVVVELAIRRRCARWARCLNRWLEPAPWAVPAAGDRPIVLTYKARPTVEPEVSAAHAAPRVGLTIEVGELRQLINTRAADGPLDLLPRVVWLLRKHAVPWWQSQDERHQRNEPTPDGRVTHTFLTPDARAIWRWAIGTEDPSELEDEPGIHAYFRGTPPNRTRHDAA